MAVAVAVICWLTNRGQVGNTTHVEWTTHSAKGLTALDLEMADVCDAVAEDLGEISAPEGGQENDVSEKGSGQEDKAEGK